jgi:dTDP-4-dehydrorhamnose reductase
MKILITGGKGNIAKMIKKNLSNYYEIDNPSRQELNILNKVEIENYFKNKSYDVLIHTAILGGRRTKEENGDITHDNLLMLENLLCFSDKFKMIINFDSGAIYDRTTDILNRKEEELFAVPTDYYGFSKYMIYKRSLQHSNMFNFRIFNIFHANEEPDRFIKACFFSKNENKPFTIFEDKYFDFFYEDDFIKIVKYYIDNCTKQEGLDKTLNICYNEKFKLSDIAKLIMENKNTNLIQIVNTDSKKNYSGDSSILNKLELPLLGLRESLNLYENIIYNR